MPPSPVSRPSHQKSCQNWEREKNVDQTRELTSQMTWIGVFMPDSNWKVTEAHERSLRSEKESLNIQKGTD